MTGINVPIPKGMEEYEEELGLFFTGMVAKLTDNAHKGKWENIGMQEALRLLFDEIDELRDALFADDLDGAVGEAVDVANFALILASMCVSGRDNPFAARVKVGQQLAFLKWASEQDVDYCLIWPFKTRTGPEQEYGGISKGQSPFGRRAHRVVCGMAHGEPPTPDHNAAHLCGVSLCCNPNHLMWATFEENQSHKKDHGTNVTPVKLSWRKAREIRRDRESGARVKELAEKHGVSEVSIYKVLNNESYAE